jgi:hypothetical protein
LAGEFTLSVVTGFTDFALNATPATVGFVGRHVDAFSSAGLKFGLASQFASAVDAVFGLGAGPSAHAAVGIVCQ